VAVNQLAVDELVAILNLVRSRDALTLAALVTFTETADWAELVDTLKRIARNFLGTAGTAV